MHIEENIHKAISAKFPIILCSALIGVCFYTGSVHAIDWSITPTLQLQEVYSDNLNPFSNNVTGSKTVQKRDKKSGFATIVTPGVSVIGRSAKNMLNLNYNLQGMYNRDGNDGLDFFNQLQFNSQHTVISDRFFVQTSSSISQQNLNNYQQRLDNIGNSNRINISTVSVSPYWTPHFGNYADGYFRVNLNTLTSGNNSTSIFADNGNLQPGVFSDSVTVSEIAQLNSGNEFKTISWNLSYNNNKTYRKGSDDVSFENYYGTLRTHINKAINIFATAGQSDNSFGNISSNANTQSKNGFYYTVGVQWRPSDNFGIEAGGGNNSYVTVNLSPMRRVTWVTTYRHNSIGLNNGDTWQTNLNYQARNSNWYLSHINNTITSQQAIANSVLTNSSSSDVNSQTQPTYLLTNSGYNDVFVTKTWNLGVNFTTGKSNLGANAFNQDLTSTSRQFNTKQTVRGVSGFWSWQVAPKTSAYLRPTWQQVRGTTSVLKNDYYDVSVGVTRSITNSLTGGLEFRHIDQSSGIQNNSYEENRATASLYMRF